MSSRPVPFGLDGATLTTLGPMMGRGYVHCTRSDSTMNKE
jgi:hypothetical protein